MSVSSISARATLWAQRKLKIKDKLMLHDKNSSPGNGTSTTPEAKRKISTGHAKDDLNLRETSPNSTSSPSRSQISKRGRHRRGGSLGGMSMFTRMIQSASAFSPGSGSDRNLGTSSKSDADADIAPESPRDREHDVDTLGRNQEEGRLDGHEGSAPLGGFGVALKRITRKMI